MVCTHDGHQKIRYLYARYTEIRGKIQELREKKSTETATEGTKSAQSDELTKPPKKNPLKRIKKNRPIVVRSPEHEYYRKFRFFYDIGGRLHHPKKILRSDWRIGTINYNDQRIGIVDRQDIWTDESMEELQNRGYVVADHLYDTMAMSGVPVVMRVTGGYVFDVTQRDENGNLLYSQDTAATLHDVMTSTATANFLKGMSKAQSPQITKQQLMFILIIAAGALFGLYMLGFFR